MVVFVILGTGLNARNGIEEFVPGNSPHQPLNFPFNLLCIPEGFDALSYNNLYHIHYFVVDSGVILSIALK